MAQMDESGRLAADVGWKTTRISSFAIPHALKLVKPLVC